MGLPSCMLRACLLDRVAVMLGGARAWGPAIMHAAGLPAGPRG